MTEEDRHEQRITWPRFLCVIVESPKRTNDDETSPPELVDEVDLELGVCPVWLSGCRYNSTTMIPSSLHPYISLPCRK